MGIVYYIEQGQLGRASAMSVVLVVLIGTGTFTVMYRLHGARGHEGNDGDQRDREHLRSDDALEGIVLGRTPVIVPTPNRGRTGIVSVRPAWGRWEPRLVVDSRYGIVDASRGFLRLVGASTVDELKREGRFSVLFFSDRTLLEIFSTREAVQERATSIMTLSGARIPVIVYANVVERDQGDVIGYFYCRRVSGRSRRLREYRRLRDRMATAEQEILKAQITPHLLFNTLNNIAHMIGEEPEEARDVVQSLADLYRYTLAATKKELVPLADEVETIRRYLSIEKARFGERLTWQIDVKPAAQGVWIPPMILQPIVENAVTHGADERGRIRVDVVVARSGDDIVMSVRDHGATPFDEEALVSGSGTGLRNVEGRLYALYGRHLQFERFPDGGLRVIMTLPERKE